MKSIEEFREDYSGAPLALEDLAAIAVHKLLPGEPLRDAAWAFLMSREQFQEVLDMESVYLG